MELRHLTAFVAVAEEPPIRLRAALAWRAASAALRAVLAVAEEALPTPPGPAGSRTSASGNRDAPRLEPG
ncbi:hypothetical protein GCM10015535_26840 [Streptomyces gelaticus]|uniref:Uncharacterized protein n=1 Tax=Streptomyces gelaticus TaxID=285446 RepID=A0ABQ2VZ60_9ACTN|nr:hypothetical protein [Streptomyces gelaticus]GGV83543.1 hypothetical protein GCM10015535_26840 [Streptomyces gelaticus]